MTKGQIGRVRRGLMGVGGVKKNKEPGVKLNVDGIRPDIRAHKPCHMHCPEM